MLLKYGYITNFNEANEVIVKLDDMDGFTTDYIPFVVHNLCFKVQPIKLNALVAVLLDDNCQQGVCLGYVNSQDLTVEETLIEGNLKVSGDVQDQKGTMQEMRNIYNSHTNPNNGNSTPSEQM